MTELTLTAFHDAIEAAGEPVLTAHAVADALDVSQADADEGLTELAASGRVERRDVNGTPVFYPTDWTTQQARERVVSFPGRKAVVVDQPTQATRARLSQVARLEGVNGEGGYRYEFRPEDVWAAPFDSLSAFLSAVWTVLPERDDGLENWLTDQWQRARQFRLETHEDGYDVLVAASAELMGNVAEQKLDGGVLRAKISETEAWVNEEAVAELKRTLYDAGYPVQDERELEAGDELDAELKLPLREYQRTWVEEFTERQSGVMVGPPGSGKTVAAMAALAEVGGETLILVPGRQLATQWREELLAQTTLAAEQIGLYHGGEKDVRPVTIGTYQTVGMDRHRHLFDDRRWGLVVFDECLTGDTVVETRDGRTTFGELDEKYGFEYGWNEGIDTSVRTVDPETGTEWTTVTGVYKSTSEVDVIRTNVGHTLRATAEHTHVVFDPESGVFEEKRGIEEGDFLARPLNTHEGTVSDGGITTATTANPNRANTASEELLGWFLGDGHLTEYDDVKFSFATRTDKQIGIIRDLCEALGAEYSVYGNARGDETLRAPKLGRRLAYEGSSGDKTETVAVPSEAYHWSEERVGALLRGLFDAEGSVDSSGRAQINTVSPDLADDVSNLLAKLGVPTRRMSFDPEADDHSEIHRLHVPTAYNDRFSRLVGFRLEHKSGALQMGASPATGLPVGELLEEIVTEVSITHETLGSMMNLSRPTVGDVIRGKYRIGQPNLQSLPGGLRRHAEQLERADASERGRFGVTYDEIADEMGCSTGSAYRRFDSDDESAHRAIESILQRRAEAAREYAHRLDTLKSLQVVEVTAVEDGERQDVYDFETGTHTFIADGFLTHNCQHIPAPVFKRTASIQGKHRLGLTATPVREDGNEKEIYSLIGPPIGTDWDALFDAGYVQQPEVELRFVPWDERVENEEYAAAVGVEKRQLAATNPQKDEEVERLLDEESGKALVFVEYLEQGERLAARVGAPFISGEMPHAERARHFEAFRRGETETLVVSRVGDEGIDLPEAELAIVASGLGGSRRQGSQRAGRTMRPGGDARMYVLATRGTREEEFARRQVTHLAAKGVPVSEHAIEEA